MIPALVYGLVWRHCQMYKGVCTASHSTLAKHAGTTRQTIKRHLKTLIEAGYIEDLTPGTRGKPHVYCDTGLACAHDTERDRELKDGTENDKRCNGASRNMLRKVPAPGTEHHRKRGETLRPSDRRGADAPEHLPSVSRLTDGQRQFLALFDARRFRLHIQARTVATLETRHGTDRLLELATWAAKQGMSLGKAITSVESALESQAGNPRARVIKVS